MEGSGVGDWYLEHSSESVRYSTCTVCEMMSGTEAGGFRDRAAACGLSGVVLVLRGFRDGATIENG
ncbi:hypothetical protein A6V36_26155 [Paraburkholderia ginsengiterrae]|uniref:Uncharacterized protein n=1 Tax=Paraburkholderia ginsengiterrae TaxID=1462993 RepID=A0A1A9N5B0_9BURK|nr:hypothetical protein A6V37_29095 [Paraburkholderia ginsengiterrae]OAJ59853.1 hypothetical protein A6V36_26155 [Paraburkholderia ginsengiterrae]